MFFQARRINFYHAYTKNKGAELYMGGGGGCVPVPRPDPEVHRAIQAAGAVRQHQRADRVCSRGAGKPAAHGRNDPGG